MSELELVVQEGLVAAGLPAAVQQHPVTLPNGRTAYLDLAYVDPRVDIEIDHSEWHATPSAVEQDKTRDLGLAVLGWERLRLTERSIERRLKVCIATICAVLDRRRPAGPG